MSKITFMAAITITIFLISLVEGMPSVEMAKANFVPHVIVTIASPSNQTYNSHFIVLNFTVAFFYSFNRTVTYSVDKLPNVTIY